MKGAHDSSSITLSDTRRASEIRRVARFVEAGALQIDELLQSIAPLLSDGLNDDGMHVVQSLLSLASDLDDAADGNEGGTERSEEKPVRAALAADISENSVPAVVRHEDLGAQMLQLVNLRAQEALKLRAELGAAGVLVEQLYAELSASERAWNEQHAAMRALQMEHTKVCVERNLFRTALQAVSK